MVLHKHGEYLYNQVQMILQKRSEDLLERLGWRGPPLPSPNSLNSSSARLKHRHALQGGAEYGRDVPPRAQEAVGGLQARPRGANPPRFLQRRERSSQPSGMLRCLLVLLSSIRLAGFGFALPALPAAERENRGRRVWRCLPSCAEPMAAPARCSPRSSFQKRRATIVSGGIPQCILGDARGAGADGARHPHVHGPDLRQAEQQVRPSSRAPARPSAAIGCGRHPERRVRRGRPATAEGRAVARRAQGSWRALLTAEGAARLCCRYVRLRLVGGAGDRRVA